MEDTKIIRTPIEIAKYISKSAPPDMDKALLVGLIMAAIGMFIKNNNISTS